MLLKDTVTQKLSKFIIEEKIQDVIKLHNIDLFKTVYQIVYIHLISCFEGVLIEYIYDGTVPLIQFALQNGAS